MMMKKNAKLWMKLLLVFALIAGLALPAGNVSVASKSKKKKVLFFLISKRTREQKNPLPAPGQWREQLLLSPFENKK